jgi:UDP-N-acetylglucosamine:LPS N-acetylglucosamine transferase
LENMSLKTLVVRGIPESGKESSRLKNTFIENHLNAFDLQEAISKSECVLSRPGYSTIMDLAVLGGKAVFVPTPGQTEQEYLATYCASKNTFGFQKQENFNLKKLLEDNSKLLGITLKHSSDILSQTVAGFLKRLIDA